MFGLNKYEARKYREAAMSEGSVEGAESGVDAAVKDVVEDKKEPVPEIKAQETEADVKEAPTEVKDGPSDREAELLKESMSRKKALKEANDKIQAQKEALDQWEGMDVSQVQELVKAHKDAETQKLEDKGQFDKIKEQMVEAHNLEKQALETQIAEMQSAIESSNSQIDNLTVGTSFGQSKFISDELTLPPSKARVLYSAHFEREDNGRVVGYDKPKGAADRAQFVDVSGDPLGFDAALKKIIDVDPDRDSLYRSKAKPGAGSNTDPKGKSGSTESRIDAGRDRIAAGIEAGLLKPSKGLDL